MKITKSKILTALYIGILLIGVGKSYYDENIAVSVMPVDKKCIVIDAGHGGFDPGKVASDGVNEKNINLAIASKLSTFLEEGGAVIRNTRIEDSSLSESKRNQDSAQGQRITDDRGFHSGYFSGTGTAEG